MRNSVRWILVAVVCFVLGAQHGSPLFARQRGGAVSCWDHYVQFVNNAWNEYDACVKETNEMGLGRRIAVRQLCRLNWLSDALQGEFDYTACMAIGPIFRK
jgi:hypothetical protein